MPEGHTIHRVARDQTRDFAGQKLRVSSPQGRFADGAKQLDGRRLLAIEAHGKHLAYRFDAGTRTGGRLLHIHLGLYGKYRRHKAPPPEPRGAVRLRVVGDEKAFDLNGPNCCELLTEGEWSAVQGRLGPDPLRKDADAERLWTRLQKSRGAIGALLLNQAVVAGVGNIYRSEVLHLLDIHPDRPGNTLTREEFDALWALLVELLEIGVKHNRIIIADPADVGKPRSRMNRDERLLVYKKQHCSYCESPIASWELGARKVYACTSCQVL
ncbi:MAG: DNA-formamidopyrimidine glycosylase family protein [Planctomycetota bacterium]